MQDAAVRRRTGVVWGTAPTFPGLMVRSTAVAKCSAVKRQSQLLPGAWPRPRTAVPWSSGDESPPRGDALLASSAFFRVTLEPILCRPCLNLFLLSLILLAALSKNPDDPKSIRSSGPRGRSREGHAAVSGLICVSHTHALTPGPALSWGPRLGCSWGIGPDQEDVSAEQLEVATSEGQRRGCWRGVPESPGWGGVHVGTEQGMGEH